MSMPENIDKEGLNASTPLNIVNPISSYIKVKHLLDISLITLLSPVIVPVMLTTAAIIKLESKGPVFFWQKRVGAHGKVFNILKFRSMRTDSEKHGSQFAKNDDDRVTKFGRFIRKMRIDELPQLWNIIRGEMSLIGPRPEQVNFVNDYEKSIPGYMDRHRVLPGITGLAQIKQGYVDNEEGTRTKLNYDLEYIDKISFEMDTYIVFQTIYTMATGFGAR